EAKDGKEEEEVEYDEHVWLSLKNAKIFTKKIADVLSEVDKDNAKTYQANYESYAKKLDALDKKYAEAVASAKNKTLVFGDRFPFRYLVNDYGLDYYAAFVGCSAESEASFETVTFLAKKVDELGLSDVLTIEGKNHKIAKTVIENTKEKNQKVLTLDSMQSTTAKDVKDGATYLGIMEKNLEVLKEALK
ncbi:MAG: zinc ABC transporter substrate-binding protein, partial [[Eubacterium] sulci]|nr:zinc ABC transporter substrate-binding protein [[Eubacterium] sulci]